MSNRARTTEAGSSRTHTQGPRRPSPERNPAPNPYTTIPPPTTEYITLYIKLQRRRQCFRIVQVPANYTFALLHTYIRFLFGLTDRPHRFDVVDHVRFHWNMKGHVINYGRWSKKDQESLDPEYMAVARGHLPAMKVVPVGTKEKAVKDVLTARSDEVTLGQIWNTKYNVCSWTDCSRDCQDDEIAIKYQNERGGECF